MLHSRSAHVILTRMKTLQPRTDVFDWENARNVLARIEGCGESSRAVIAKQLGLSRTTVSTIVGKFMDAGLVAGGEGGRRGRGRPGIPLALTSDRWYALGAEFRSGRWVFVITDLHGKIVESRTVRTEGSSPEAFLRGLMEGLSGMMGSAPDRLLAGVGIGAPGLVDCRSGVILRADDLGWSGIRLRERVERELGVKAWVLNRNRASGLAEARFGAGRGVHAMVYIGIGTGISAAIISEGVLMHGANYSAGEIGHIIMDPAGPLCGCGKHGCLHALASGTAMARMAEERLMDRPAGGELTGELVCREAAAGDPAAIACVGRAAQFLGIAVANIITTFNPDKIVLGGPVGQTGEPLLGMVQREAARWAMDHPLSVVSIETGLLGEYTGALGGACLVLDRKLDLVLGQ